jgi:hypothetical protein
MRTRCARTAKDLDGLPLDLNGLYLYKSHGSAYLYKYNSYTFSSCCFFFILMLLFLLMLLLCHLLLLLLL